MEDLNKRKIESIIGIYRHPDISKFVYYMLTEFETPVVDKYVKQNLSSNNETNISFPNNAFQNTIFPNNGFMNTSFPSNVFQNTTFPNNGFMNTQPPNNGFMNTQLPNNGNDKVSVSTEITNNEQLFIVNDKNIKKTQKYKLYIAHTEKNNKKEYFFISKKNKNNDIILPEKYSWIDDDNLFQKCIMNLSQLHKIVIDPNKQYFFEEIHFFLTCFEKLLLDVFVPVLFSEKYRKTIHQSIIDSITLPVIIAFGLEFKNTEFSLDVFLMKNNYSKINDELVWINKFIFMDQQKIIELFGNTDNNIQNFLTVLINNFEIIKGFTI